MNRYILYFLLFVFTNGYTQQLTTWENYSTEGSDANIKIVIGQNESRTLWTIGEYKDSFNFNENKVRSLTAGAKNLFWARMNMETGKILDYNIIASTSEIKPTSALLCRDGGLLISGELLGSVEIKGRIYQSEYDKNPFIVKISKNGAIQWFSIPLEPYAGVKVKSIGLAQIDDSTFVTTITTKNIFTIKGITYIPKGGEDSYFVFFNAEGEILSVKSLATPFDDKIETMIGDSDGNIYIGGVFNGVMQFDEKIQISANTKSGYLAKFNKAGKAIWAKAEYRSPKEVKFKSIAIGSDKRIAAVGEFENFVEVNGKTITPIGRKDMLVVSYDESGKLLWSSFANGINEVKPKSSHFDNNNNLYIIGEFRSGFKYASLDTSFIVSTCDGSASFAQSGFLVKYTPAGNVDVAKSLSPYNFTKGEGLWTDFRNDVYVSGTYFKNLQLDTKIINSTGSKDFFVGKINMNSCDFKYDNSKDFINRDLVFMHNAYPNPTQEQIYFTFHILKPMKVKLEIFDIRGKKVADVVDKQLEVANYVFPFSFDNTFTSGTYLYRLSAEDKVFTKRLVLLR